MTVRAAAASLLLAALPFFFSSCASTPKDDGTAVPADAEEEEPYVPSEGEAVSISIPTQVSRSYFSTISPEILELVETGSPASLRQAALRLRKTGNDAYAENEKVLLATASEMLSMAYPSESISWDVPAVDRNNPYLGALDSARGSIYDSSTGNSDFLTLVLPSFVFLKGTVSDEYYRMALPALTSALSMREKSVIANYLMGLLQEKLGNAAPASAYVQAAFDGAPGCIEIGKKLAELHYLTGQYAASYSVVQTLLASHPSDETLLALAARDAYGLSDFETADSYAEQVSRLNGDNLDYTLLRAQILMQKGDYIKASSLLDVYSRTNRTSRDYLLLRSQLQLEWNKNTSSAADTIAQALSYYPSDAAVLLRAAEIASASNTSVGGKTALQLAEAVLGSDGGNLTALEISVAELVKASEWSSAYALSTRLIDQPSAPASAQHAHVDICIALYRTEEAWNRALRLYNQDASDEANQQTYIKALIATGRRSQASLLIDSLLNSSSARMRSFLYYQRSRLDATEEAVLSDLRASLTANPRNEDALYRLYELYYQKSDWRRAQYYLKQVVALNPLDARLLRLNAELDALLGK